MELVVSVDYHDSITTATAIRELLNKPINILHILVAKMNHVRRWTSSIHSPLPATSHFFVSNEKV